MPELYWSCGEVGDGVSLIRRADDWAIVIGERGTFDVRASTAQADEAVRMFVEMVVADYEATMAGAEATQDWLRSRGRKRP
ncbi:MAG: hypothetical protein FIA92_02905 [Chloroflexi bacterium]|nr:hypothetical protein [Chloroflexota bacterium]